MVSLKGFGLQALPMERGEVKPVGEATCGRPSGTLDLRSSALMKQEKGGGIGTPRLMPLGVSSSHIF